MPLKSAKTAFEGQKSCLFPSVCRKCFSQSVTSKGIIAESFAILGYVFSATAVIVIVATTIISAVSYHASVRTARNKDYNN